MPSPLDECKRALVALLRDFGLKYGCAVNVSRGSSDQQVQQACRTVARKVHPDKPGGSTADFQRLSAAHDAWGDLLKSRGSVGRPRRADPGARRAKPPGAPRSVKLPGPSEGKKEYRVHNQAVLLTYQGLAADLDVALRSWAAFLAFVKRNMRKWAVRHWTATRETNQDGKHHLHLMLELTSKVDRTASYFVFEGRCPNVRPNDLLGEAWCGRRWRVSVDRGHFYVYANKKGAVRDSSGKLCVEANYEPAWTEARETYEVKADWPEKLWKAYKLEDSVYFEEYLFLCKDKLQAKKRNFETFRAWQRARELEREIAQRTQSIRGNPELYRPFGRVRGAEEYLALFDQERMRCPVLLVHAPSFAGKSEFAVSLFKKPLYLEIGASGLWPPGMKLLGRNTHDGLVLDDLRDLEFIHANQEKLQGKYNRPVTLFNTPGGELACTVDLYRFGWEPRA